MRVERRRKMARINKQKSFRKRKFRTIISANIEDIIIKTSDWTGNTIDVFALLGQPQPFIYSDFSLWLNFFMAEN